MSEDERHEVLPHVPSGVWQHYKGPRYFVLGLGRHSETEEVMVVYVRLYSRAGIPMSIRPATMFLESVMTDEGPVPRFRFLGTAEQDG